jgi:hypothetical protein
MLKVLTFSIAPINKPSKLSSTVAEGVFLPQAVFFDFKCGCKLPMDVPDEHCQDMLRITRVNFVDASYRHHNSSPSIATNYLNSTVNDDRGAISMNDVFNRLRWPIFEDISNIRVLDGPKISNPDLLPFVGHAIATEPASQIPLTEIAFLIYDLAVHHSEFPDYTAPEDLCVSRADGGIVTVKDVVEQLSVYF